MNKSFMDDAIKLPFDTKKETVAKDHRRLNASLAFRLKKYKLLFSLIIGLG
jgi:hypothetical protein